MKFLIVNADDFGYSRGINRGIIEAHERGVVTSTSFIVNARFAEEAARMARDVPSLSVGIHVNFTNEAERLVDFEDVEICRTEIKWQVERFVTLIGRPPTHMDSHQHVHRDETCLPCFQEAADELGIPLRDAPPVVYKGGFYAQWEYGVSDPSKVSLPALERILRTELAKGIYELCCHPGYYDPDMVFVYHRDRELELETLCHPGLRAILAEEGIRSIGFHELASAARLLANAT